MLVVKDLCLKSEVKQFTRIGFFLKLWVGGFIMSLDVWGHFFQPNAGCCRIVQFQKCRSDIIGGVWSFFCSLRRRIHNFMDNFLD
jgi:hypothetical protein